MTDLLCPQVLERVSLVVKKRAKCAHLADCAAEVIQNFTDNVLQELDEEDESVSTFFKVATIKLALSLLCCLKEAYIDAASPPEDVAAWQKAALGSAIAGYIDSLPDQEVEKKYDAALGHLARLAGIVPS